MRSRSCSSTPASSTRPAGSARTTKSVAANCACKAKTEVKLADPAFKEAVAKQQPYDKFPFGDPADYQKQVLTDCPAIRPLMVEAMCNDPAAPGGRLRRRQGHGQQAEIAPVSGGALWAASRKGRSINYIAITIA